MSNVTVISRKTPKTRRPVDKKKHTLRSSLRSTPYTLEKNKKFSIGRASKNSMSLRTGTVSEKHAVIKWDKSSFKITDANSTNGTFVNGRRIKGTTILKSGDKIKIGQFVVTYGVKKVREKLEAPKKRATRKKAKLKSGKRAGSKKAQRSGTRKPARKAAGRKGKARKTVRRKTAARRAQARKPVRRDLAVTRIRF